MTFLVEVDEEERTETGEYSEELSARGPLTKIGPFYMSAFQMPLHLVFRL